MAKGDARRLIAHLEDLREREDLNDIEDQAVRHAIDYLRGRGSLDKQEHAQLQDLLDHLDTDLLQRYNIR